MNGQITFVDHPDNATETVTVPVPEAGEEALQNISGNLKYFRLENVSSACSSLSAAIRGADSSATSCRPMATRQPPSSLPSTIWRVSPTDKSSLVACA